MTPRTRPRKWREVKRRPVPGNSPNDRILHGPGCNRPKRVCADSFSATPSPQPPRIEVIRGMRFSGMTESIGPMGAGLCDKACRVAAAPCRAPLVRPIRSTFPLHGSSGARFAARSRSSSAMSSGRLFLDRVARQHCPSPLHRHRHHKSLDQRIGSKYHRTVRCGLSGCLTLGVHPTTLRSASALLPSPSLPLR